MTSPHTDEMQVYFAQEQLLHDPLFEFGAGRAIAALEIPTRVHEILRVLEVERIGQVVTPRSFDEGLLERVHSKQLIKFLRTIHDEWTSKYPNSQPYPETGIAPGMNRTRPTALRGQLAYFCFDTSTHVLTNTWEAAKRSTDSAIAGVHALIQGARCAFALCRPPGHHAGTDFYGGYCFLNNAAIAAQVWLDTQGGKCSILDIDYHHGNGTQQIFYDRSDVLYASLHGDPEIAYPFFSGATDEKGYGKGLGFNVNVPLPSGTRWSEYEPALICVLEQIAIYEPDVMVISLGVDTAASDPTGSFSLDTADFEKMGKLIRSLDRPMLITMEGGYCIDDVGRNVASFFRGLLD
jgi:acetoin utilization deacetylase AcuC-like enzyme